MLGQALDSALKTLQARHTHESAEARYLAAIVDDSPSALLTVDEDGRVEMLNKAARQLFMRQPMHALRDLEALGPELAAAVQLSPGTRKITRLLLDGVPQKVIFASAQVARLDRPVTVLSILPVQSELGALEVAAQADLVRVLTHEIMNSLTPVTSLARSGAEMVAAAAKTRGDLGEARRRPRRSPGGPKASCASSRAIASSRRRPTCTAGSSRRGRGREEILQLALANAGEREDRRAARGRAEDVEHHRRSGAARPGAAQPHPQRDPRDERRGRAGHRA